MFRLPLSVIYAMLAFNITAFAVLLQIDMLIFHAVIAKFITWTIAVGTWSMAYANRNRFVTLF